MYGLIHVCSWFIFWLLLTIFLIVMYCIAPYEWYSYQNEYNWYFEKPERFALAKTVQTLIFLANLASLVVLGLGAHHYRGHVRESTLTD